MQLQQRQRLVCNGWGAYVVLVQTEIKTYTYNNDKRRTKVNAQVIQRLISCIGQLNKLKIFRFKVTTGGLGAIYNRDVFLLTDIVCI